MPLVPPSERRRAIETAAYGLLAEKGYVGMTISALARRARASNETLYNWYGDKAGLVAALISANAETTTRELEAALANDGPALACLEHLGPTLLTLLTGDRAVALNRAAAADGTGALGQMLAELGRGTVGPLITATIARAVDEGALHDAPEDLFGLYMSLLVGDLQIRRCIGVMPMPSGSEVQNRAATAWTQFIRLAGAPRDG